eukprot:GHVO01037072.1.p1 GENE.GHVO01037072.1~~GHVO01037072.1.p1  ORF type:complete len:239 (+),score=27.52 GHVO01037072.1:72-719(+)
MPITIAYWDIRGLGQPARLLLEYCGQEYENKMYTCGPAPTFDRSEWLNVKPNLGLDFPNLPYLIDGDIKISQSNAVFRYIGRRHNLCGTTDKSRALCDVMADQVMDMRNAGVGQFYGAALSKEAYIEKLQGILKAFDTAMGDNPWLCGTELTFPDFHFYELLDQNKMYASDCLKKFPRLQAYTERFEALPKIKAYMESNRFMKSPVNNKTAQWIG